MNQRPMRYFILFAVMSFLPLFAEPSVYGFNLNSGSTRGLNSTEKVIVQNKKSISLLRHKVARLEERIDGLTSIIEGLNASISELKNSDGYSSRSSKSSKNNTALLKDLGSMIDKINNNYVTKEEFQKALKGVDNSSVSAKTKKPKKQKNKKPKESLKGRSASKLYREGVRLFMKRRYNEAKKRFTITDIKGYKPAASNYYLGEIAYYTKSYEDAVFYFKKSAGLNDRATYIDTLLLHTAVSLEKGGDKEQARIFYESIIDNYSGKKSAKIAKQKLKKL